MQFEKNLVYHIFNQGNNRQRIFFKPENYLFFLKRVREHLLPHVDFLCYCLMPNHFHFLVHVHTPVIELPNGKQRSLNDSIAILLRSYTRAINVQEGTGGALFREGTKAKNGVIDGFITIDGKHRDLLFSLENSYARVCFQYIHDNPKAAGLVTDAKDWPYSSLQDYLGIRKGTLCNQELARQFGLVGSSTG